MIDRCSKVMRTYCSDAMIRYLTATEPTETSEPWVEEPWVVHTEATEATEPSVNKTRRMCLRSIEENQFELTGSRSRRQKSCREEQRSKR